MSPTVHSLLESEDWAKIYELLDDIDLLKSADSETCFAFGRACRGLGIPEIGYAAFAKALELDPTSAFLRFEALYSLLAGEEWDLASRVLHYSPDQSLLQHPFARWISARCKARLGNPQIAEDELLALQQEQILDMTLLGIGLVEVNILLGDNQRASFCLDRLFAVAPDCEEGFFLQLELMRSHSVSDFSAQVQALIDRAPKSSRLYLHCADALAVWMHLDQAEKLYQEGIAAFGWRGKIVNYYLDFLASRGSLEELESALSRCDLKPYPQLEPALLKARCLMALGRHGEAESLLNQEEDSFFKRSLMVEILKFQGEYASALNLIGEISSQRPLDAHWSMMLATQRLAMGLWLEGWDSYEARFFLKNKNIIAPPGINPVRSEERPHGRNVLVFGEQGFGDTVMMSSMIPDLLKVAKSVTLFVQPKLAPLFQSSFPDVNVISEIDAGLYQSMDACYGIGSLGRFFRLSNADFPGSPYLSLPEQRQDHWRGILNSLGSGLKVGIAWRGGGHVMSSGRRSIALADLSPVLQFSGVHFINLQYKHSISELKEVQEDLGICIHHFDGITENLLDTAALTQQLDLVITVQQTALHIAGSVGTPAWVLVPVAPEWRYGYSGSVMAWYDCVRLFRQSSLNDWTDPIEALTHCFQEFLLAGGRQNGEVN